MHGMVHTGVGFKPTCLIVMDTVTTTTLGGFCSYLFYHFLDNILHDMAWIIFTASWRRLREIALQGCNGETHGRMGYGHLANSTWSTAHLQSIMHRRTKRKKKKAEKKIECDKITVSYIAAGLLCLLYFLRGMPTPWLIACGEYSASFFHHFIFHLTVVDVRHFCWDCYICSFFFSIGAGDMIQVHHTLHRFFFLYFSLVTFRFSCGYITLFHHVGRRDLRKAGRLGVLWVCGGDGWDKVLVWIIPFHCLFLLVSTHLYAILWIHGWIGRITFCMYILRCTIMVSIAFCSTSLKYLRFFGE